MTKTLLIVDDDPQVRLTLREVVEVVFQDEVAAGALGVYTAASGEEAVEQAIGLRPDLIVMDVDMPGISGIEAFHRIRETTGGESVKTVFLTGYAGSGEVRRRIDEAVSTGALGFLVKPLRMAALKQVVAKVLFGVDGATWP